MYSSWTPVRGRPKGGIHILTVSETCLVRGMISCLSSVQSRFYASYDPLAERPTIIPADMHRTLKRAGEKGFLLRAVTRWKNTTGSEMSHTAQATMVLV